MGEQLVDSEIATLLVDLSGMSLAELRFVDADVLNESLRRVLHQVERPRANIGNTGPPGRAD